MSITAKVTLSSKNQSIGSTVLQFMPDYQDGKNKEWASSTPSLDFKMTVKPEVGELFKPGASYMVTFTPEEG